MRSAGVKGIPVSTVDELVAALPGIVWEADGTDYVMSYVSPQALELLGHDPAEWLEVRSFWEDHLHPDDRERVTAEAQEAIASLASRVLHYRFRDADGDYRWIRDSLRVVEHEDGHRHVVGFMADVGAEASADAERQLLATAVEGAAESVVVTDADGSIVYVNPGFERITGYSRDEVIGRNPRILQSGAHDEAFYAAMWRRLTAGQRWAGELVNRRRDGKPLIEEASITPVIDPNTGVRHYLAVKRDITAERDDRATREWMAAAVESAMDAVYTVSSDGIYVSWNAAAERIYGWRAEEVIGRSIFDVVHPDEHASIRRWIDRVCAGESIGPQETTHRGAGGRTLTLSVVATPVRDGDGQVTGLATVARDISAQREEAARRAALEAQLRQAQKMEAIGRLAGAIAHDFNNLLTAIRGYADMAADQLDGPVRDDVEQVRNAADRASDLTRRLLAFARSSATTPKPVQLDAALLESARLVERLVPERIGFELHADSGATITADPSEVEQLLLNLVVNAVDAIDGAGKITVRCVAGEDGTAVLTVRDTGSGMDAETLDHIFEPFFTTKADGRGTGLGLATVFAIVQRAHGTIDVRSRLGWGTTFTITLPAAAREGDAVAAKPAAPEPGGRGEHVLVVEDSDLLRSLAGRMLSDAGYAVSLAASPADVLRQDLRGVDALVCDVVMPGMSGPEMVRRLDRRPPVVFVSGYANDELRDLPADTPWTFLPKPYSREALLGAVDEMLRARPAAG